jgi:hypothetical protein
MEGGVGTQLHKRNFDLKGDFKGAVGNNKLETGGKPSCC